MACFLPPKNKMYWVYPRVFNGKSGILCQDEFYMNLKGCGGYIIILKLFVIYPVNWALTINLWPLNFLWPFLRLYFYLWAFLCFTGFHYPTSLVHLKGSFIHTPTYIIASLHGRHSVIPRHKAPNSNSEFLLVCFYLWITNS